MKKKFTYAFITCITISVIGGYIGHYLNNQEPLSDILLANIEALSQEEATHPSTLVPDHYLEACVQTITVTCNKNGSITIGSSTITGSFQKGKSYPIVIEVKNCSGIQEGAFCDQNSVGVKIIS